MDSVGAEILSSLIPFLCIGRSNTALHFAFPGLYGRATWPILTGQTKILSALNSNVYQYIYTSKESKI